MKSIAQNFAELMDRLLEQYSTERVIELARFDKSTISQWKNGHRSPGDEALFILSENMRLPTWFREECRRLMKEKHGMAPAAAGAGGGCPLPTCSFDLGDCRDLLNDSRELDADGNGIIDANDGITHARRAERVLERLGGKR